MSVPMPRGEHLKPVDAPSPPEEPPGVRVRLCGFTVVPVRLLEQSRCWVWVSLLFFHVNVCVGWGYMYKYHEALGLVSADVEYCSGCFEVLQE